MDDKSLEGGKCISFRMEKIDLSETTIISNKRHKKKARGSTSTLLGKN